MKIDEEIRPVTYLKSHAADLLAQVNEAHRPVIITQNGKARAVIQAPESFERMRAAIVLLKLMAQGEDDLRGGRTTSQEKVFGRLEEKLKAAGKGVPDDA